MSAPLVLLHGFTGSPASWDAVCERLDPRTTIRRETLLGHGSADAPDIASFEDEVNRIAAGLRAAGLDGGAHLAGYSLGARVALGLLVRHGDLFARATLIGGSPGLCTEAERAERARADARWIALLETRGLTAFVDEWETQPLFASQARLPEAVRAAERTRRLSHRPAGLARSLRVLGLAAMPDLRPHLGRVSAKVTLVAGAGDAKFVALAQEMAGLFCKCTMRLAPDAGHNVPLERPGFVASLLAEEDP